MGFHFVVMFIDSFMDDVTYVRGVEVCVERYDLNTQLCLKMGPIGCSETSTRNYRYSLRNKPDESNSRFTLLRTSTIFLFH